MLSLGYHRTAAWSPDGKHLASGAWNGDAIIWDAATGQSLCILTGPVSHVTSAAWSPDGKYLVSGSMFAGSVIIWDLTPLME